MCGYVTCPPWMGYSLFVEGSFAAVQESLGTTPLAFDLLVSGAPRRLYAIQSVGLVILSHSPLR